MFFIYSLKVALCLTAFYLVYKLMLSRDTFHAFNRAVILAVVVLSLVMPWMRLSIGEPTVMTQGMVSIEGLIVAPEVAGVETHSHLTLMQAVFAIYIIGVAVFFLREVVSVVRLTSVLRGNSWKRLDGGIRLVVVEGNIAPFSWFRYVVISRQDYNSASREIMTHEMAHVRKLHSVDVALCNILIIFQWFNPAAWLLKRELQAVHEYEADAAVIKEGVDARQYQLLLIKKSVGERLFSMANNFNHNYFLRPLTVGALKKRIIMMTTKKSNPWQRIKALAVLPVAAVAAVAFASPEVKTAAENIEAESNRLVGEVVPQVAAQSPAKAVSINEDVRDTVKIEKGKVNRPGGKIAVMDVGSGPEAFEVVEKMPSFPGGTQAMMDYLIRNIHFPESAKASGKQGRVIVQFLVTKDGDITDVNVVHSVDPEFDAEAVRVVSGMPKWNPGMQKGEPVNVRFTIPVSFKQTTEHSGDKAAAKKNAPLYLLNGKKISMEELGNIPQNSIESMTVLKNEEAVQKYGEEGRDGVVIIKTKE